MGFTKGNERDDYARVYDRLRKRSYRNPRNWFLGTKHEWYVRGVRDALAAMEKIEDDFEQAEREALSAYLGAL